MTPPPHSETGPATDRATAARYLMLLYAVGPVFGLIGLALPHAADAKDDGILAVIGVAWLAAAVFFVFRRRLPEWALDAGAALGTILVSAAIYFSGSATTAGAVYYLWVILGAAYFFDRRRVALQLVIVAVGYAVALLLKPSAPGMVQAWIVSVGTLSVAAALLVHTRERVASLLGSLAEAADTDPLTGLLNRRGFDKRLELEFERARRYGTELSLIAGDLDNFKQVNDRFGHQVGDDVLIEVGELLHHHARRTDAVARLGGEEFSLVVAGSESEAMFAAERLRERVRAALADRYPGLTISFGIATYPDHAATIARLLRCADEALYAAKTLGRDRSVAYSRELVGGLAARPRDTGTGAPANLTH